MVTYYSRQRTSIQCVCYSHFRSYKMGDIMNPVWICRLSADRSSNIGTSLKHFIRCLFSFLFFLFFFFLEDSHPISCTVVPNMVLVYSKLEDSGDDTG